MFSVEQIEAIYITLKLAAVTSAILLVISAPLAWWLAKSRSVFKLVVEAIVALPLVLPPTVLGFYLLVLFSPDGFLQQWGLPRFSFTFTGLVIGSIIYSLPFAVQPLQNAFMQMDRRFIAMAESLGASPVKVFKDIVFPLVKPGVITAFVLSFAHTVGEFGVVLMIGGNIVGETQVLSIAIFEHVESFQYDQAHKLSLFLLLSSFLALFWIYRFNHRANTGSKFKVL
jgi:molybdate transport system permease protein